MDDNSSPGPSSNVKLLWRNRDYALVTCDGVLVGAIRRRLDGGWDSLVGDAVTYRTSAARRVVQAYRALADAS